MSVSHLLSNPAESWVHCNFASMGCTRANATIAANAATVSGFSGSLTDSAVIAAATTRAAITITHASVTTSSIIMVEPQALTAATNNPCLVCSVTPQAGSFLLNVRNIDAANATAAAPIYRYWILQ